VEEWRKERNITIEGKAAKPITSWVEASAIGRAWHWIVVGYASEIRRPSASTIP
jgi:hypothetical protein